MTKLRLLSTAAAILALGAGGAFAQGMKEQAAPEKAPAAQRQAPAEKVAPSMNHSQNKASQTTGQGSAERVEHNRGADNDKSQAKPNGKPSTTGQTTQERSGSKTEMKGEINKNAESKERGERHERNDRIGSDRDSSERRGGVTTGQGAASGAKLSTEQRTKITTIFKSHRVEPTHLSISVHVGARVPANVHFYPVPVEVVTIYPEWRGYDYILVGDEILIVDPRTHEIVAVLEA